MARKRKKDYHLPHRVYCHRGWHFFVDHTGKWHKLGRTWDRQAKEKWLEFSEGQSAPGTVAHLLDDFLAYCAAQRAKRTLEDNQREARTLKLVFARIPAHLVAPRHVKSYLDKRNDRKGKPAAVRANREIALLSSAYAWALGRDEWPSIALNPCYGVPRNPESPRRGYVQTSQLVRFGKRFAPDWMRRYVLLKRITGLRQGELLSLTPANIAERGLELVTAKTTRRKRFRWTWRLRVVIDSICGSAPDVKRVALFTARHGGPLSARGFKAAWARAMRAYMAAGGARFREDDIRVKRARDASSFRHQQENPGREELSRGERPDRANVVKVTPLRCLDHEYLENERDIW